MPEIILASSSPGRRDLLTKAGLKFRVVWPEIVEPTPDGENPEAGAISLALAKARAVAARYPEAIVIGADTFGVIDSEVLGKPNNAVAARAMLRRISGQHHTVVTGLVVIGGSKELTCAVTTEVYINTLSEVEIDVYIATGEPLDKAGAYGIQGRGRALVARIDGEYDNVVGLPLRALAELLSEFGVYLSR